VMPTSSCMHCKSCCDGLLGSVHGMHELSRKNRAEVMLANPLKTFGESLSSRSSSSEAQAPQYENDFVLVSIHLSISATENCFLASGV